jgi:5-methylcytosine-specific restriction endonuclease McrA
MAATPDTPLTLIVVILQRYVGRIRETLRAQRFPEAEPDPRSHGPLIPAQPGRDEPYPYSASAPRTPPSPRTPPASRTPASSRTATVPSTRQSTRTQAARAVPSRTPSSGTPSSRTPSSRTPSSRTPSSGTPSSRTPPPRDPPAPRQIPEPVGERHSRRISQDVKIAVSARDGGRCRQCGSTENLHFDHIIPVSKGGANTVANIQLLCGPCNRAKAAK